MSHRRKRKTPPPDGAGDGARQDARTETSIPNMTDGGGDVNSSLVLTHPRTGAEVVVYRGRSAIRAAASWRCLDLAPGTGVLGQADNSPEAGFIFRDHFVGMIAFSGSPASMIALARFLCGPGFREVAWSDWKGGQSCN